MGQKFSALPSSTDFIRENPFERYRDDLEQHRLGNQYLGHTMFWKNADQLPTQHIYHTDNVEYRNMKLMFLEMIFYFVFLTVLTVFVTNSTSSVEYESREQQLAFWKVCARPEKEGQLPLCSLKENSVNGLYDYLSNTFGDIIFNDKEVYPALFDQDFLYDLDESSQAWAPRYLGDTRTTVLLGSVRARQLRVLPNRGCILPENLTSAHPRCYGRFHEDIQSTKFYAKRRMAETLGEEITRSYEWQAQNRTEMTPMTGLFGTYPGDGFVVNFPLNRTDMTTMLRGLSEWQWIDVQTRALIIEVSTFNPNVNVIAVNRLLFEFAPTGQLKPFHDVFILPTHYLTMSMSGEQGILFVLQVLAMITNICFFCYHAALAYKDPFSYITYTWNMVDIVNLGLAVSYTYYRTMILYLYSKDNNLQPELAGMPTVYMPYVQLEYHFHKAQCVLSWLCLFSWVRTLKYLSLSQTFRVLIRTLEASCFQLGIFAFLYVSVTVGFAIAFVVGFGASDTTEGLYSTFGGCFFTLFFMLKGGVDLDPILGRDAVSYMSNWILRYLLFLAYMILIALLFFNFFKAIVIDTYTRVNIQLADFSPRSHAKKNPCMVFLYTYYYKWRGIHLVGDDEENIGGPDEQYIELALLPGFLAESWKAKREALREMIEEADAKAHEERNKGLQGVMGGVGKLGRRLSMGVQSKITGARGSKSVPVIASRDHISRLQLQRLMDDAPEIMDVLGCKRAIDVIRRFRSDQGPDPYSEITRLQENVILKLDSLEKIGLNLEFSEVESLKMVSNGLNDALTEVQNQWRGELTNLLESCSLISNHMIDLTDRLAACTEKHNEIARDIQVEDQMG